MSIAATRDADIAPSSLPAANQRRSEVARLKPWQWPRIRQGFVECFDDAVLGIWVSVHVAIDRERLAAVFDLDRRSGAHLSSPVCSVLGLGDNMPAQHDHATATVFHLDAIAVFGRPAP